MVWITDDLMLQEVTILPMKTINSTETAAETQRVVADQQGATLVSEGPKRPLNQCGVSVDTSSYQRPVPMCPDV